MHSEGGGGGGKKGLVSVIEADAEVPTAKATIYMYPTYTNTGVCTAAAECSWLLRDTHSNSHLNRLPWHNWYYNYYYF